MISFSFFPSPSHCAVLLCPAFAPQAHLLSPSGGSSPQGLSVFHLLHLISPVQITKPSSNPIFTSPHPGSRTCCSLIGYLTLTLNVRSKLFSSTLGVKAGVYLYSKTVWPQATSAFSEVTCPAVLCALPHSDKISLEYS